MVRKRQVAVSNNRDTPKSSILIGFCIINHPFSGTPIFGNTQVNLAIVVLFIFFSKKLAVGLFLAYCCFWITSLINKYGMYVSMCRYVCQVLAQRCFFCSGQQTHLISGLC